MRQAGTHAALDRVVAAGAVVALLGLFGCAGGDPTPIRQGSGYGLVPPFSGRAAAPRPLVGGSVPRQPSTRTLSFRRITSDTSGGVYFYLDHRDRAVLGTAARRIEVVAHDGAAFHLERAYDLAPMVPEGDAVTAVLPDWTGRYWF